MAEQPAPARRYNFDRVVRMVLAAAVIVGLFLLLRFLSDVLIPFAAALLLAYLLNPIVNAFESKLHRRLPAVLLTVFSALLIGVSLLLVIIPLGIEQVRDLGQQVQQLQVIRDLREGESAGEQVQHGRQRIVEAYRAFHDRQSAWVQNALDRSVQAAAEAMTAENIERAVKNAAARIAPGLWGVLTGVLSFLVGLTVIIVVLIYLIFILLDYRRVSGRWPELLPPAYRTTIVQFVDDFSLAMRRYFRGQFLVALGTGIVLALGFSLIGLRMGLVLGLFIGMLNMVPYLMAVGVPPALLLGVMRALEHGSSIFVSLLLVLIVFAVAQVVQDVILGPRILGKATGLPAWTILLGVFVWGKLLGFLGLLLAIPLTCLVLAYYSRFVLGKLDAKVIQEE